MKIICECGQEGTIHCPPLLLETTCFVLGHATRAHQPDIVKVICACGAERLVGPGLLPKPHTDRDVIRQGFDDGKWFAEHAGHETN